jgi:uncharacterized protein YjiS (DUF1127 family)
MTAIELASSTGRTGRIAATVAVLRRVALAMAKLYRVRRNRNAILRLSECSDYTLQDIGVTRHDVRTVLGGSPFEDPSARLGSLADMHARQTAARHIA